MVDGATTQPGQLVPRVVEQENNPELVPAPTQHQIMVVKIVLEMPKKQDNVTKVLAKVKKTFYISIWTF